MGTDCTAEILTLQNYLHLFMLEWLLESSRNLNLFMDTNLFPNSSGQSSKISVNSGFSFVSLNFHEIGRISFPFRVYLPPPDLLLCRFGGKFFYEIWLFWKNSP